MCGIFCYLYHKNSTSTGTCPLAVCEKLLKRRGPNLYSLSSVSLCDDWKLDLSASVLWTQGENPSLQPIQESGNILCWNGDIFGGILAKEVETTDCSDTSLLSRHLLGCVQERSLFDVVSSIEGPYSIIFLNQKQGSLWFGRDQAGRHSLLWGSCDSGNGLIVSSVAHSSLCDMQEVPAIGLFEVHLPSADRTGFHITLHPWYDMEEDGLQYNFNEWPIQVKIAPPISRKCIFRPPKQLCAVPTEEDLLHLSQIPLKSETKYIMETLLKTEHVRWNVETLHNILERAVEVRTIKQPSVCQNCLMGRQILSESVTEGHCLHSKVAVLFSGGLDSAILAALVHKFVPEEEPIDLLNVAFEKKKKIVSDLKGKKGKEREMQQTTTEAIVSCNFDVPDRLTGRKTLQELQVLYPQRKWNFVEIDVSLTELQKRRSEHIGHLIHPLKTVLDDSLGCALWFAARGQGTLFATGEAYTSPARIVILGMGADEQFGGYMRHRTALKHKGWEALQAVLQEDLRRIPSRNLGRDDRVVADHGRQPRMPYLDESVVEFAKSLAPWIKCCPNDAFPCGTGDKLLLRLLAWRLGLKEAATFPKRALQFGSRIANSCENATDISIRLQN